MLEDNGYKTTLLHDAIGHIPHIQGKYTLRKLESYKKFIHELINTLLEYDKKLINVKTEQNKETILHKLFRELLKDHITESVASVMLSVLFLLRKNGISVNERDKEGKTPLALLIEQFAQTKYHKVYLPIIRRMLLFGADAVSMDKSGNTTLSILLKPLKKLTNKRLSKSSIPYLSKVIAWLTYASNGRYLFTQNDNSISRFVDTIASNSNISKKSKRYLIMSILTGASLGLNRIYPKPPDMLLAKHKVSLRNFKFHWQNLFV